MSKQVAVLITNEFEDSEFTSPAEAIKAAGHKITTIEKKRAIPLQANTIPK